MNRIRALREEREMTQAALGNKLNVKDATISKYETEKIPLTTETIIKLAKIFDVSTDYLLCISDNRRSIPNISNTVFSFLPERLTQLLKDNDNSWEFYSQLSKIPLENLKDYSSGIKTPNAYEICKLAEVFDTSADFLFGLSNTPYENIRCNIEYDSFAGRLKESMDGELETDIAKELNLPISQIKDFQSGYSMPEPEVLYQFAQLFKKSTDYLLGIINENRQPDIDGNYPYQYSSENTKRFKELITEKDIYLPDSLGITPDELDNLVNYGFVPHVQVLIKLSQQLHVSIDYLLNQSDLAMTVQSDEVIRDDYEKKLLYTYRILNEDNKIRGLSRLLDLVKDQENESHQKGTTIVMDKSKTGTDNMGK